MAELCPPFWCFGPGGIAAAVIRASVTAVRTGNRKKRSFKNGLLRLSANGSSGAQGEKAAERAEGGLVFVWQGAAIAGKPVYGLPEAHFEAHSTEEGLISSLARQNSGIAAVGPLPARRAGGLHERCIGPCSCVSSLPSEAPTRRD